MAVPRMAGLRPFFQLDPDGIDISAQEPARHFARSQSASPDEPASPTPAATYSTTGRSRRLRHLINHHESRQSGTTPGPFLENDDGFETELVEIKPSQRD
ncbi:hypothetical protein [Streptomyces sp. NBC_01508]|uniref:hypothetical protein n=1 Tax=Streptomyces sp. NBC_01508 TaxID=2903888 RepID=UPI003862D6F4